MSSKRHFFKRKGWVKRPLHLQVAVVVSAFALMVLLSYRFMSRIEHENMIRNVNNAMASTKDRIAADLMEPETFVGSISETIRDMITQGENPAMIEKYIAGIRKYISSEERIMLNSAGIFCYFEASGGVLYDGIEWVAPQGYIAEDRPWYKAAVTANGKVAVTDPYFSMGLSVDVLSFARRIFDEQGRPLGIVCLDVTLDRIKKFSIETYVTSGGYGILLDRHLTILAHPEPDYVGKTILEINNGAAIQEEIRRDNALVERKTTNYQGEPAILFVQQLENGWYLAIMTYEKQYFSMVGRIAKVLITMGAIMAIIVIVVMIRIISERFKSDERIQAILNAMPLCANIWNKNLELVDCNEEALRLFDQPSKKEFFANFKKLSPEYQPNGSLSKAMSLEYIRKAFDVGYCRAEWMHQKLNGEKIPCDITLIRIKLQNEFFVTAYMQDLRELKSATEKSREADERMQLIFDTAPIGCLMFDRNFTILDCNNVFVNMLELPNKQVFIERFFDLSPEYQPCGKKSSDMVIENNNRGFTEGFYRFEWMHQTLSGKPVPCEVIHVRVKYKDDYAVATYVRDLREHKALLNELHNENEKNRTMAHWYESLLDSIPFSVIAQDIDENCTYINTVAENVFEIERGEFIGKPCKNLGMGICNTENCAIACAKRGRMRTYFSHIDDSYQIDSKLLKDLNDNTVGYIEVIQDITQLEQITKRQAEAEAANTAKSTFLAKVSHEIRTPMNAILGITEIQLQNENLPPEAQEALGTIYNSGYLLLGIINDILDLSKIEAGKLELMPVNYDVASLINDTIHLNIMRYDSKPIEFKLRLDENIPSTLLGDDLRIKQILNNLLSNAFKYTDSGEIIFSINVEKKSEEPNNVTLVISVKDTGHGMAREQIDKLYEEYTRFNTEANRTTIGTGLGMTITKHLVQIMNGDITVESELGKGSLFTVRLPQEKVDEGVLGKELAENLQNFRTDRMSQMKKMPQIIREYMPYGNVLVVDDVETNLYVAKGLMTPYGLKIDTASSGFEAVKKIKEGLNYDIVFMDHFMPRMDGIEASKIIRELGYTKPIIALTANALAGQAEMFMANGFDGFISKPIDIRQLDAALNKFIRDNYPPEVIEAARLLSKSLKKKTASIAPRPAIPLELAGIFTRDAERTITTLEAIHENNYRRNDDIQTYIINVHAMKSALANIGENELSEKALILEQAGREDDVPLMINETPPFVESLKALIEKLTPKEEISDNMGDQVFLRDKLAVIQAACINYDIKAAKRALAELREKTWEHSVKESLDNIAENLLHSDFEKVAEIAGLM